MKTSDELDKIKAVVLYILSKCNGAQDFVSLVKKMYFAQQRYLVLYGRPIFNDMSYSRERGPVPSFTYKALFVGANQTEVSPEINKFNASFSVSPLKGDKLISSKELPDMDELAVAEVEVIDAILRETNGMTAEQLSAKSHKDKAWIKAKERMKDDPTDGRTSLVSIARAEGHNLPYSIISVIRLTLIIGAKHEKLLGGTIREQTWHHPKDYSKRKDNFLPAYA